MAHLIFSKRDSPQPSVLDGKRTTVGRELDNDIVLDDETVSGRHAEIVQQNGTFVLRNVDTSNGTKVNGSRIGEVELNDGDRIAFGSVECVFQTASRRRQPTAPLHTKPCGKSLLTRQIGAGRIPRFRYWILSLVILIILQVLFHLAKNVDSFGIPLYAQFAIAVLLPLLAIGLINVQTLRLHDLNLSGWFCLLNLIPFAGSLIVLILCGFVRGQKGVNRFGPDPLEEEDFEETDPKIGSLDEVDPSASTDIEFDCPHCQTHIAVDQRGAGMELPCPRCSEKICIPDSRKHQSPYAALVPHPASPPPLPPANLCKAFKNPKGEVVGLWVANPGDSDINAVAAEINSRESIPVDLLEAIKHGQYRIVANQFGQNGGAFLMFGNALAPGESIPLDADVSGFSG